jgi:hypothetical protein
MIAALACWSKIGLDRESEVALARERANANRG